MTISRYGDGWIVKGKGYLRTLRAEGEVDIDMSNSKGVTGYIKMGGVTYIHLDGSGDYFLVSGKAEGMRLINANGQVEEFLNKNGEFYVRLNGYIPLEFSLIKPANCQIWIEGEGEYTHSIEGERLLVKFKNGRIAYVKGTCKD